LLHSLDLESGSISPHIHKKRRTDVEFEGLPSTIIQTSDGSADNQIEEELTLALTAAAEEENKNGIINGGDPVVDGSLYNGVASDIQIPAEIVSVVSNLMGRAERVQELYARDQQASDASNQSGPRAFTYIKASSHLKTQSLPILDNLVRCDQ
jgi:hypothetical protein